mgnify:CR=1 FL=1
MKNSALTPGLAAAWWGSKWSRSGDNVERFGACLLKGTRSVRGCSIRPLSLRQKAGKEPTRGRIPTRSQDEWPRAWRPRTRPRRLLADLSPRERPNAVRFDVTKDTCGIKPCMHRASRCMVVRDKIKANGTSAMVGWSTPFPRLRDRSSRLHAMRPSPHLV